MKAIGGEMELAPAVLLSRRPLAPALRPGLRQELLRSGRGAIRRAVELSQTTGPWLLPSYMCDSVKQPFDELGVVVHFYRVDEHARIDATHLRQQITAFQPVGLLFINYFGMPLLPDEVAAVADARAAGCFIIEDGTHGSVLEAPDAAAGQVGDFIVSSLRKYLPVPDGALLRFNSVRALALRRTAVPVPTAEALAFAQQRAVAKGLRWEFLHGSATGLADAELTFIKLFAQAEKQLDASADVWQASMWAHRVLAAQKLELVRQQRRLNFAALLTAWEQADAGLRQWAVPLYGTLPLGVSPFAFPILVSPEQRDAIRKALVGQKLFCPVLWPIPSGVSSTEFASSYELSSRIICLPIDQRYSVADMRDLVQRFVRVAQELVA